MSKSNKELTAEITIALINANPRLVYRKSGSTDGVTPSVSIEAVSNIMDTVYAKLKSYED